MCQPTRGNATKTHSLRLESELIDSNRVKVWHSYNLLTLHHLLLHLLNFLCEKLHFFSRYYVENSAHFWPFLSVDVTIISIVNCQSNNASQQLGRVQTSVMSQQILRYEKEYCNTFQFGPTPPSKWRSLQAICNVAIMPHPIPSKEPRMCEKE